MTGLIVHEWVEKFGGSEQVLRAAAEALPQSDLFCLWNNAGDDLTVRRIIESRLATSPLRGRKAAAVPAMLLEWRRPQVASEYEWMFVSSHAFAHHVRLRPPRDVPKYVYVHSPARYLWVPELDPRGSSAVARSVAPWVKAIDRRRAQEKSEMVANSRYIADRIRASWHRDAGVIYPPVDVEDLQRVSSWSDELNGADQAVFEALPSGFVLGASRFVEYKRLDVAIRAAELLQVPAVIAGGGPDAERLRSLAGAASVPVHFVKDPSTPLLRALMQAASLYVFAAEEDFGIMPVEAMALGTPTIVNVDGGARESVEILEGGRLCVPADDASLRHAVETAVTLNMEHATAVAASMFGKQRFKLEIREWVAGSRKA